MRVSCAESRSSERAAWRARQSLSSIILGSVLGSLLGCTLGCADSEPRQPLRPPERESRPVAGAEPEPPDCLALEREALFERRVTPLIAEGSEPTCARCHLPGVDFRPFIQEGECETLACMEEESLVDLVEPKASKILAWIARGHEAIQRSLEDDPVARAEHGAFLSWIQYQASCGHLFCEESYENPCQKFIPPQPQRDMGAPDMDALDMGPEPLDMGGLDMDGLDMDGLDMDGLDMDGLDMEPERLDMELPACSEELIVYQFTRDVWPQHGRCYHCHADSYSARSTQNPQPAAWMSDDRGALGAQITSERLREQAYLNLDEPSQSLILLKPLTPQLGGLDHGGGTKMRDLDDGLYAPLLAWIEMLAACRP